jgi:AraC-like DNA-binding protein
MNRSGNRLFEQFQRYGRQSAQGGAAPDGETVVALAEEIGTGYRREVTLAPGLRLYLEKYTLTRRMSAPVRAEYCPFGLSVCLSGRIDWTPLNGMAKRRYATTAGNVYLSLSDTGTDDGIIECAPDAPIVLVSLLMDPSKFDGSPQRHEIAGGSRWEYAESSDAFFYSENALCPSMEPAVRQLFNCNLSGTSRKLYLRAKALELIALAVGCPRLTASGNERAVYLSDREKQQLQCAKDILSRDYASPPSLRRLARRVGLNATKLKKGFRQVFNTCVSAHILDCRMEQARKLLEGGQMNVSEVAYEVGYANRSHFTRAFIRRFQCPPMALLKQVRGED